MFDLGFFEEVEDLKYSYATLKQEATKLANKQVGCTAVDFQSLYVSIGVYYRSGSGVVG